MANTNPRRHQSKKPRSRLTDQPWTKGDPTRTFALNVPIPEPLMLQLDFLVEHRLVRSKASFIRDIVGKAAAAEIQRARRLHAAMKQIEAEEKKRST